MGAYQESVSPSPEADKVSVSPKELESLISTIPKQDTLERFTATIWSMPDRIPEESKLSAAFTKYESAVFPFAITLKDNLIWLKDTLTENYAINVNYIEWLRFSLDRWIKEFLKKRKIELSIGLEDFFLDYLVRKGNFGASIYLKRKKLRDNHFYFALADEGELFIVSNGFLDTKMIYFDFWLDDPQDREWIAEAYVKAVIETEKKHKTQFTHICLIRKPRGPCGPLKIAELLRKKLEGKEIFYYCETPPIGQPRFWGNLPSGKIANVLIIYDYYYTGHAIKKAKEDLRETFNLDSVMALVVYIKEEERMAAAKEETEALFPDLSLNEIVAAGDFLDAPSLYKKGDDNIKYMRNDFAKFLEEGKYNLAISFLEPLLENDERWTLQFIYGKARNKELDFRREEPRNLLGKLLNFYAERNDLRKMGVILSRLSTYQDIPIEGPPEKLKEEILAKVDYANRKLGALSKSVKRINRVFDEIHQENLKFFSDMDNLREQNKEWTAGLKGYSKD